MKDLWHDIKEDLLKAEEPLSDSAWQKMHSDLDDVLPPKKKFPFIYLFMLLGFLILGFLGGKYIGKDIGLDTNAKQQKPKPKLDSDLNKVPEITVSQTDVTGEIFSREENLKSQIRPSAKFKNEVSNDVNYNTNSNKKYSKPISTNTGLSILELKVNLENNISKQNNSKSDLSFLLAKGFILESLGFPIQDSLSFSIIQELHSFPDHPKTKFRISHISKFQLKIFGGPNYSLNSYSRQPKSNKTNRNYENVVNNAIKPLFGYESGFELYFNFYKNFRIGSGLILQELNTYSSFDFEIFEIPVIEGNSGEILAYITLPESRKVNHEGINNFQFLSIPLSFYYERRIYSKWLWSAEFIQHFGFLNHHKSTQVNSQTLELYQTQSSELNSFISSSTLNCGLHYQLSPSILIGLEPRISYAYQNLFNQEINSWRPIQFGLNFSTTINFTNL